MRFRSGGLAVAEEPAQAIAWLLSDAAAYVTGAHLITPVRLTAIVRSRC